MTQQCSSLSSFLYKWRYDVFLSFRGEDTRTGFTGNLYNALYRRGINTFMDDAQLKRGEEITPGLVKAIEESRIAIVVFSENYASSIFCLDELVQIISSLKEKGQLVLPIFYKVHPSQVRHQTGSYGKAMVKYEGLTYHGPWKVQKWRSALSKAANLSGYHFEQDGDVYEYVFIEKILKDVSTKINRIPLHVADHPVGLVPRVNDINSVLDVGSNDGVNMVGIYGMGGVGKSTIARAVYNLIADGFEDLCFLSNVREKSIKKGLTKLQETMLFELTGEKDIKFGDINRGISVLKSRLNQKKILLVLDDIDKLEQLQALAGGVDWFGSGSRILITTRDMHLLNVHNVNRGYHMKILNYKDALELFNWKTFKRSKADPDYEALSERAVLCGHGLPLALEVIGSNLYGKTINEWNSALDEQKESSDEQVQEVLRVSYTSLKEREKDIFLDIACFFNGETLQRVKTILLHSRGFTPDYALGVLAAKSLIKITKYSKERIEIHHLIQDMGQKIVRQESPLDPGRRSRLWFYEDIIHVLETNKGTDKIQFMILDAGKHEVQWSGYELKKMINLRALIIKNVNFSQGPRYMPDSLRVLDWEGYPSSSLQFEFPPRRLALLELRDSIFTWDKALKKLEQLKVINFRKCRLLKQVPDVSEVPNLTELYLDCCYSLIEIHDSVGFLDKLRIISAECCFNLVSFPRFLKLKSLERLNLNRCRSLQYFPEVLGNMENLSYISINHTAIEELPCSIQKVPTCILMLPKLKKLHVGEKTLFKFIRKQCREQEQVISYENQISLLGCNFLDGFLPTFLGCFPVMTTLELCGSNLKILPECIQACKNLQLLNLNNCKQLREIRGIPPNMEELSAINCTSLVPSVLNLLLNQNMHSCSGKKFTLPGTRIPEWVDHNGKGASLSFWFRNDFPNIALFGIGGPNSNRHECRVSINGHVLNIGSFNYHWSCKKDTEHIYLYDRPHLYNMDYPQDQWNHAEISYEFKMLELGRWTKPLPKETWVYIYDKARIKRDILFTNPNLNLNPEPSKEHLERKYQFLD